MRVLASLFMLCIGLGVLAQSGDEEQTVQGPKITFQESTYEFGEIVQGNKVSHTFTYENTGTEPLIISNVRTTCGCTATNWSKEPLAPGASATLTVNFNSTGKMGMQNKVVTILSNATNSAEQIKITGNVIQKPEEG